MAQKHLNITLRGRVQGVWFRHTARIEAQQREITGFVANEPDGSVRIEAEGDEAALANFVTWCHRGPALAKVEDVKVKAGALKQFEYFTVR